MKIKDADILIVPGYTNAGPDHWQSRWQANMATARRVSQRDWHMPDLDEWVDGFQTAVADHDGPTVIVAHSLGCQTTVQALTRMDDAEKSKIRGIFMVAPPDVENEQLRPKLLRTFGPYPREPLHCPSILVASRNDEFCEQEVAADMANAWGSLFIDARESGHINTASGHGPWPDGLMVFANFMKRL